MPVVVILIIVLIFLCLFKLLSPPLKVWKYGNKIPGPKPLPIIGNGLIFLQSKPILKIIQDLCDTYGTCVRLWLGKQLFLVLTDPADIEIFLTSTKHLDKSDSYRMLDPWLGTKGLLTSDADVWRPHRKLLTPSFHFKILETSIEMMRRNSDILCDQLESKVNQPEFDIHPFIEKCSLDVICEGVMGTSMDTQRSNNSVYLDAIKKLETSLIGRIFQPWLHPDLIFRFSQVGQMFYGSLPVVKSTVAKVITERRRALIQKSAETNEMAEGIGKKQVKPFLDFMLLESSFTEDEIENEVQTFMFAGHDTTTTTISFCLYLLSKHPDVQDKVLREAKSVLLDRHTEPSYSDYHNMKYLDNVIKETLRMYTTVPVISRKVAEDMKLSSGLVLPAGALVNLFLLHMHNNEKYFPNPDQFIPERFESKENRDPYVYVPFSAGPRNCIGQKFAMLEMKIILSTLILKYRFLPSERVKSLTLETCIVLRSLENTPVRITFRNTSLE